MALSIPSPSSKMKMSPSYHYEDKASYIAHLQTICPLPAGFQCSFAKTCFTPVEAPHMKDMPITLTLIKMCSPTSNWAAVFTKNTFPGAPVIVGKALLLRREPLQAIVVNNKVSNVCAGGDGISDVLAVSEAVAQELELTGGARSVLASSTGVIGWRVPRQELISVIPAAAKALQGESFFPAAESIMTTDRFPKAASRVLSNGSRITGIAKGAGMIEPNMATMLSYLLTDAEIDRDDLQRLLKSSVDKSYNSVSVDGDESTSDTVVCVSSNAVKKDGDYDNFLAEFAASLDEVCGELSELVVRNGEGTTHVIEVEVTNFPGTDEEARRLGRHVVNSPLFKCAVAGNDPNTGRLAAAVGSFMGKRTGVGEEDKEKEKEMGLTLSLGDRVIFSNGQFVLETEDGEALETELSDYIKDAEFDCHTAFPSNSKTVKVGIVFENGNGNGGSARVLGSDLTSDYVVINADYRS